MKITGFLRVRLAAALALLSLAGPALAQGNYTLFESGPVRPVALSPNGAKLFVCNIPDGRLEIFDVSPAGLAHVASVPVGVEPVAVAARNDGEVWVVNHLSDSVSIVDVASLRVVRTLLVGDEPRDIVFAGSTGNRAFITAAHRGQNRPGDPELLTPGVGRSDVWVFEATGLGAPLGGTPLTILNLFGDTPRALAVSPIDGTVYAAVFHSGNQTTAVNEGVLPTPPPLFSINDPVAGVVTAPQVAVMLQYDPNNVTPNTWLDVNGGEHAGLVRFQLPDRDVFAINPNLPVPAQSASYAHVGTILYNMAVNPISGAVYVSNTDANNMDRFEGFSTPTLRGELHRARITIVAPGAPVPVSARNLNTDIDYSAITPAPGVNEKSLGIPTDLAVSSNGATLYVAAFGSSNVAIIDTAALALAPSDAGAYQSDAADQVELSAGGPGGLALDESNNRLYVYTRFDNGVSIVNLSSKTEGAHLRLHNPELPTVLDGRRLFYDTRFTSSNGEASCAVCHVFGDFDSLAWDLGDPDGTLGLNNNPFVRADLTVVGIPGLIIGLASPALPSGGVDTRVDFHPLKGPMTTQTLRGMQHHGPMHWRGDRSGGLYTGAVPGNRSPFWLGDPGNALDEEQAFKKFNPAFVGLLGRQNQLTTAEMQAFTDFILQLQQPPNPIRNLDNTLTADQQVGSDFFNGDISDTLLNCNGCHTLSQQDGFFGTGGLSTFEGETQHFKVAHLRNIYQKVGMFGSPADGALPATGSPDDEQIRGFGYLHDGSVESVVRFLNAPVFQFPGGDAQRTQAAEFTFAFPSDVAPVVGQQLTLTSTNAGITEVTTRLGILLASAATAWADPDPPAKKQCDLVVKGRIGGQPRGWWMSASGPSMFTPDLDGGAPIDETSLRLLAGTPGQELTYTCVPAGSGPRMGIDRGGVGDGSQPDGIRDGSQCGDVTADGVDTPADVAGMRAWLAGGSPPAALAKCNVRGANGSLPANCDIADVATLRRALGGLPPAQTPTLTQGCVL